MIRVEGAKGTFTNSPDGPLWVNPAMVTMVEPAEPERTGNVADDIARKAAGEEQATCYLLMLDQRRLHVRGEAADVAEVIGAWNLHAMRR